MDRHTPPTVLPVWSSGKASQPREGQILIECYWYVLLLLLLWAGLLTVLLYEHSYIATYSINWVLWLPNLNIWRFIPFRTGVEIEQQIMEQEIRGRLPGPLYARYASQKYPENIQDLRMEPLLLCFYIHWFAVLTDRGIVAIAGGTESIWLYRVLCTCGQTSDTLYFISILYIVCFESEVKNSDPSESAENRHPQK